MNFPSNLKIKTWLSFKERQVLSIFWYYNISWITGKDIWLFVLIIIHDVDVSSSSSLPRHIRIFRHNLALKLLPYPASFGSFSTLCSEFSSSSINININIIQIIIQSEAMQLCNDNQSRENRYNRVKEYRVRRMLNSWSKTAHKR